ncbi:hypothetical protein TraAM80_00024 [Trypanosoma rangeli]|uniref:B box-type domain-containing protein n=1 Tax=Trypanosoma rangeli TaxID=5698 RepID=A0A422P571_TRYRA|nr:uncharacterized protein TraAM80_00024 [Trypanosoma rangeli]RNF12867.1 hypothetical protein TraAM80_00024 [Trypanosoma rangeli]|eukprot:RNF12867.1 hypothetical protein TraAM80_00024 [Trypanosoma rangeli]
MSETLLACTVCGESNAFPDTSSNAPQKATMTTFCKTCGGITLQRVVVANKQGERSSESVGASVAPGQSDASPYHQASGPETSELLWRRLQDALANNGVTMAEFFRVGISMQTRLISAVGFNHAEIPRLLKLTEAHTPSRTTGTTIEPTRKYIDMTTAAATAITPRRETVTDEHINNPEVITEVVNGASAETLRNFSQTEGAFVQTPLHSSSMDALMLGPKAQEDDTLIARCSVYPHLNAEFWCSICGVLVSSRCHVSGIHKDHPFITLRQAADAHVRDLSMWSERCRSQLNVANTIVSNLQRGKGILNDSAKREDAALDMHFEEIVRDLTKWCQGLKSSMQMQINAQLNIIDLTVRRTNELIEYYAERLKTCDTLLRSIPLMQQVDGRSEKWSLRVMDLVSRLKMSSHEPIPMPRVTVPEVKSFATMTTYMELLKAVSVPAGIRVPDVLDTGYLNFPNPSDVGREAFTLQVPKDAKAHGLLIYGGRTLTRLQDVTPTHSLVCASRTLYAGVTAWEVHVDSLGAGPGRILAGVLMAGTDGEGVVWDGQRIVGPNEGECRVLPEKYRLKRGTTLRFILELEAPSYFLICYFEDQLVARVPLPPVLNGWIPAFSVFGPQDQVTVVPLSSSDAERLLADANPEEKQNKEDEIQVHLSEQERKLNALHQQLLAVNSRIDQDQYERFLHASQLRQEIKRGAFNGNGDADLSSLSSPPPRQMPPQSPGNRDQPAKSKPTLEAVHDCTHAAAATAEVRFPSPLLTLTVESGQREQQNTRTASYSPELQNLLNFVESIK